MRNHLSRQPRGFTLIELMMAVSIIGLLAALAIPNLVIVNLKAKRSEREVMIDAISREVQDLFQRSPGQFYLETALNPPITERQPLGGESFPWDRHAAGWNRINVVPDGPLRYRYQVFAKRSPGGAKYTIQAVGDLDANGIQSFRTVTYELTSDLWNQVEDGEYGDSW